MRFSLWAWIHRYNFISIPNIDSRMILWSILHIRVTIRIVRTLKLWTFKVPLFLATSNAEHFADIKENSTNKGQRSVYTNNFRFPQFILFFWCNYSNMINYCSNPFHAQLSIAYLNSPCQITKRRIFSVKQIGAYNTSRNTRLGITIKTRQKLILFIEAGGYGFPSSQRTSTTKRAIANISNGLQPVLPVDFALRHAYFAAHATLETHAEPS